MSYNCFVSYSRADRQDAYVQQFINDLRRDLSLALAVPPDKAVFFDTDSIQMATEWEPSIRNALSTTKVCVSLCSPNYFHNGFCGREYKVFLDRRSDYLSNNPGKECNIIFPLVWIPTEDPMPQAISRFQYTHPTLPPTYAEEGLLYLMKLNKYADEYREFLRAFIRKIVAAQKIALPDLANLPSLSSVDNVFSHPPPAIFADRPRGPSRTYFVFCAASNHEMDASGQRADSYGDTGWDWAPYGTRVGVLAQDLTAKLALRYDELDIAAGLVTQIHDAERNKEIVIIVLDARTMNIPRYTQAFEGYDQQYFINSAVLVPWHQTDIEIQQTREALLQQLNQQFPRKLLQPPLAHSWEGISNGEELRKYLEGALNIVRMNVLALGKPVRKAESEQLSEQAKREGITVESKPILRGPNGSSN
jgi:FxsC-like protein